MSIQGQCCSQVNSPLSDVDNIETEQNTDYWIEDDAEFPQVYTMITMITMLTATDFLEDSEREQIYSIAPDEGSTQVYLEINFLRN